MKHLLAPAMLALVVALSGCGSKPTEQAPSTPTALAPGQTLFLNHCVACHQGVGNPPGPNAVILDSGTLQSEDQFRELVRHPKSAMMTSFSEQELGNADVHLLYEYLQAAKTPKVQ